uniref:Glycosyltransferase 2-like domain-containing protein n=1 Tax=viral metagenome TaxID=1070528 RepID=A0A6C0K0H9_9ZZZZ
MLPISIIIPSYEEPIETLIKTVDQFINYDNIEVIISDSSLKKIPEKTDFKKENVSIVYSTKKNISAGRNIGAKHASNDIVIFLDADVVIEDIPKTLEYINKHINTCGCIILKMSLPKDVSKNAVDKLKNKFFCKLVNLRMRVYKYGRGECIITKKQIFNKVGGFDETKNVAEDSDLTKKLGEIKFPNLYYIESGRRILTLGWIKMLKEWNLNHLNQTREWEPIGR